MINKLIATSITILSLYSCKVKHEECNPKFKSGDEVVFRQDTTRVGIVIRHLYLECDVFYVSYFTDKGKNTTDAFNVNELIRHGKDNDTTTVDS